MTTEPAAGLPRLTAGSVHPPSPARMLPHEFRRDAPDDSTEC